MNRIKLGDTVRVISGKNKGLEGTVTKTNIKAQTAIVEGLNKVKKHQKQDNDHEESGIIEIEAPIRMCKLALLDPKGKGVVTKVKYAKNKDGKKIRVARKTGHEFSTK